MGTPGGKQAPPITPCPERLRHLPQSSGRAGEFQAVPRRDCGLQIPAVPPASASSARTLTPHSLPEETHLLRSFIFHSASRFSPSNSTNRSHAVLHRPRCSRSCCHRCCSDQHHRQRVSSCAPCSMRSLADFSCSTNGTITSPSPSTTATGAAAMNAVSGGLLGAAIAGGLALVSFAASTIKSIFSDAVRTGLLNASHPSILFSAFTIA